MLIGFSFDVFYNKQWNVPRSPWSVYECEFLNVESLLIEDTIFSIPLSFDP